MGIQEVDFDKLPPIDSRVKLMRKFKNIRTGTTGTICRYWVGPNIIKPKFSVCWDDKNRLTDKMSLFQIENGVLQVLDRNCTGRPPQRKSVRRGAQDQDVWVPPPLTEEPKAGLGGTEMW